jgi:hypothetical protein
MNSDFQRRLERAFFTLTNAEALGVKFHLSIEVDYPRRLPAPCIADIERAVGQDRVLIFRLILERAGAAP